MRRNKNPDFHAEPVTVSHSSFSNTDRRTTLSGTSRSAVHRTRPTRRAFITERLCCLRTSPCRLPIFRSSLCVLEIGANGQENGRFEINKKICLTITSFHKEEWSPSWSSGDRFAVSSLVETILQAISSMIPVPSPGAIGSIETPDDEVRALALKVGDGGNPHV